MELYVFVLASLMIQKNCRIKPYKETSAPFMGESAICDFLRREDELMTELMNHK
jgi:hypothetical protein